MAFDQAQSARLGQKTPIESTYVLMFSGDELPEASWPGQMIYRNDTQGLQVFNGNAWEDVVGGQAGSLTFVGPTPPVSQTVGDIWFDSSDANHMYRAASVGADEIAAGEWEDMQGAPPIPGAKTFYQDTPPTVAAEGDLWFETDNKNKQYYYHLATWVSVRDATIADAQSTADGAQTSANAAQTTASNAQTVAASKATSFYQTTPPTSISVGDIWFDTDDGYKQYRANAVGANAIVTSGNGWYLVQDALIPQAVSTANGKNTIYYATTEPTVPSVGSAFVVNDLWFDTSNGYAISVWDGGDWVIAPYGGAALDDGAVTNREISSSYAYVGGLRAEQITTGNIVFGIGIAALLRTPGDPGTQGVEIDPTGLRIIGPNDPDDTTTLQPGLSVFKGSAEVTTLVVKGGSDGSAASFRQKNELSRAAVFTLSNGVTPPSSAPVPLVDWAGTVLTGFDLTGFTPLDLRWDASQNRWMVAVTGIDASDTYQATMLMYDATGAYLGSTGTPYYYPNATTAPVAGTRVPGVDNYWLAPGFAPAGKFSLFAAGGGHSVEYTPLSPTAVYSLGWDGSNLVIGEGHVTASVPYVRMQRFATSAVAGANLVPNGTFETNVTSWSPNAASTVSWQSSGAITGAGSLRIHSTGPTGQAIGTAFNISPSVVYQLSMNIKTLSGTVTGVQLTVQWLTSANALISSDSFSPSSVGTTVVNVAGTKTAPATAAKARVVIACPAGDYLADDVIMGTASGLNYVSSTEVEMSTAQTTPCNGIYLGSGDLGANCYVVASATSAGNYALVAPVVGAAENGINTFPLPPQTPAGIGYDGTNFWTLGSDKVLYKHEGGNKFTTEIATWWAASTYKDTVNGYETGISPPVSFTMKKRARLVLSVAPRLSTGVGDPNAQGVYLARQGTTPSPSQLHAQPDAVANQAVITAANFASTTPGTTPFPASSPAEFRSDAADSLGGLIQFWGDGTGRIGQASWDALGNWSGIGGGSAAAVSITMRRTTSAGQVIPTNTTTIIGFENLQENIGGVTYNSSTKLWTVPEDGTYLLTFSVGYSGTATGTVRRTAIIMVNGSQIDVEDIHANGSNVIGPNAVTTKRLVAGDTVGYYAWQNSGADLALQPDGTRVWGSVTRVDGVKGDKGDPGDAAVTYSQTFNQASAAATWTLAHNQNRTSLSVYATDSNGDQLIGEVLYPSTNTITLNFAFPETGIARVYG